MIQHFLAVDTSSRTLSVAMGSGRDALFEVNLEGTPRHSEQLIDLIEQGLKTLHLKKNELGGFLWGLGPGSFTGLRIGLSALKGFHLGFGKSAFGASSLDLIALGSGMTSGELAVCVDARRERMYTALYRFRNGNVKRALSNASLSLEQVLSRAGEDTVFAGDALLVYGNLIRKRLGKKVIFLDPIFWYPRAASLIRLYHSKLGWLAPLSLRTMLPMYLRRSEAEEKLGRRT